MDARVNQCKRQRMDQGKCEVQKHRKTIIDHIFFCVFPKVNVTLLSCPSPMSLSRTDAVENFKKNFFVFSLAVDKKSVWYFDYYIVSIYYVRKSDSVKRQQNISKTGKMTSIIEVLFFLSDATPTWETPLVISSRCSTDASKFQRWH